MPIWKKLLLALTVLVAGYGLLVLGWLGFGWLLTRLDNSRVEQVDRQANQHQSAQDALLRRRVEELCRRGKDDACALLSNDHTTDQNVTK